jgi:hypothetical protein
MDQSEAPLLDALIDYRQSNRYGFTPPGHRQGRGTDDRVLEVLGQEPFRDDVLASGGLDDRRTTNKYLKRAEELMAEAVQDRDPTSWEVYEVQRLVNVWPARRVYIACRPRRGWMERRRRAKDSRPTHLDDRARD